MKGNNIVTSPRLRVPECADEHSYADSPIANLAMVSWLGRWRDGYMTWLAAYVDATGTKDTPALFVSGFVAKVPGWLMFERCWLSSLEECDITPPFHMNKFALGQGQFESWKDDKERRAAVMAQLIKVSLDHTLWSFSSGVGLLDYEAVNREYCVQESETMGHPYTICATMTMQQLVEWQTANGLKEERVIVAFERGDAHQGQFKSRMEVFGFDVAFLGKEEKVPFQAADVLAYEHGQLHKDVVSGRITTRRTGSAYERAAPEQARKSHLAFEASGSKDWGFHDARTLRVWCIRHGIPKR